MIEKNPLIAERIRKIEGSFAFIEHRFLRDGFWTTLTHHEPVLYLFLILVSDRHGLSYYGYDKICSLLQLSVDDYIEARNALIEKDLIAFDGRLFQVLSLPKQPVRKPTTLLRTQPDMQMQDPATIHQIFAHAFGDEPC